MGIPRVCYERTERTATQDTYAFAYKHSLRTVGKFSVQTPTVSIVIIPLCVPYVYLQILLDQASVHMLDECRSHIFIPKYSLIKRNVDNIVVNIF